MARTEHVAFLSRSPQATAALGAALGALAFPGLVIALDGDLGSGKTCFVGGLAAGLGCAGPVPSPTFTLLALYEDGRLALRHLDAWMEGRGKAFLADGGAEELGSDGVAVIEWAERVAGALPRPHLAVRLAHRSPTERLLEFRLIGGPTRELVDLLAGLDPRHPGLVPLAEGAG